MRFLNRSWIAALLVFSGSTANLFVAMTLRANENPPVHGINEMIQSEAWSEGAFGQYGWWLENQPASVTVIGPAFQTGQRSLFFNSESITEGNESPFLKAQGSSLSMDEASLTKLETFRLNASNGLITCHTVHDGPIQRCRVSVYGIAENLMDPNASVYFGTHWLSSDSVALIDLRLFSELSNGALRG